MRGYGKNLTHLQPVVLFKDSIAEALGHRVSLAEKGAL
jgi:hypothetical protein